MRIGIDLMGSDCPEDELLDAVIEASQQLGSSVCIKVIASENLINLLRERVTPSSHIEFCQVHETIEMDDSPLYAIRRKRGASLVLGIEELAQKKIDAFISLGNTGALMAAATLSLKLIPNIERPALLATLPTCGSSPVAVLDVGANIYFKPRHLVQFAYMGVAYQQCTHMISQPKVGLLNIGHEPMKGPVEIQEAYKALKEEKELNFVGNIESKDIFSGDVNVVVTDGFTGNILLKTAEGVSSFALYKLQQSLMHLDSSDPNTVKKAMQQDLDYSEYGGAILLGVDGIVVKCHGSSSKKSVIQGILGTYLLVKNNLIGKLKKRL